MLGRLCHKMFRATGVTIKTQFKRGLGRVLKTLLKSIRLFYDLSL
jgi:hypothetical protein